MLQTLKKYWGYDSFRPLQEDIIRSALAGNDTLGLMPTGGGKSITFQVPGMMLPGITIVVTPLISLMKDQVDNLRKRRIKAVFFHSGMKMREVNIAREKMLNGGAKFVYISPERLRNERFIGELRQLDVSLIVVDEAHCISQWGYDFRPAYLNIRSLRKLLPGVPVLALTATATPSVAQDICRQLEMNDPAIFRTSFSRSNISYIVRHADTKIYEVFHILSRTRGSSIVYVRSRRRTHEIAEYLESCGISATYYHAGLEFEVKEERQNAWQSGATRVMVATNAFGMGIDKPDVRVVVHYDIPPSLEEYYQEAGRAGRDGLPSYAVLLVRQSDQGVLRRRVSEAFPSREKILEVYEHACNFINLAVGSGYDTLHEFDFEKFCDVFGHQQRQCLSALHLLGQAGYLEFMEETDRKSRVIVTATRDELYSLHGISPNAERVLELLLRNYTGLFTDYVYISEGSLAHSSGKSEKEIYDGLLELSRAKVISFVPRSRSSLMYVPTSREEPRYVEIGRKIYEERKKIMEARTEAMIYYAFDKKACRENIMLAYFGEKAETRCGRCDTCRERRKQRQDDPEYVMARVLEFLKSHGSSDVRILEKNVPAAPKVLSETLSFLCNEGHISLKNGIYSIDD